MTKPRLGTLIAVLLGAVFVVALVILMVALPDGIHRSADAGTPVTPLWMVLLPPAAAILLILTLARRAERLEPQVLDRRSLDIQLIVLLACAVAFPLVVGLTDISRSELYLVAKLVLLIAVPGIVIWRLRRAVSIPRPRVSWRWWAPAIAVAVWTLLSQVAPWLPPVTMDAPDRGLLIAAATATLLTAGFGEELFYRWWLQTRLEAVLGRWGGIAVASLVFACMHLGGDRQGAGPIVEIAAALVVQGSFAIMLGLMWSRYRNIWLVIAAHVIVNGYGVVEYLAVAP